MTDYNEFFALEDVTAGDTAELAERLRVIQDAVPRLYEMKAALMMELSARMEDKIVPVDGVGVLVRGYAEKARWKHRESSSDLRHDIREALVKRYSTDPRSGEVDTGLRNLIREAIEDLWEVIPSFSSVKRPARRFGIDIRDYREITEVPTVAVHDELPEEA